MSFALPVAAIETDTNAGLPLFNVNPAPTAPIAPPAFSTQTLPSDNSAVQSVVTPVTTEVLSDGNIQITFSQASPSNSTISSLQIFGTRYNLQTTNKPSLTQSVTIEQGNFAVTGQNGNNLVITIAPLPQTSSLISNAGIPTISATYQVSAIASDEIPLASVPALFSQFNIYGSISISRRFGDHPSASLNIYADDSSFKAVEDYFVNSRKITFYGIAFRAANISKKIRKLPARQVYEYDYSIQLEGFWKQVSEDDVKLNPANNPTNGEDEDEAFSSDRCKISIAADNENPATPQAVGFTAPSSPLDQDKVRIYLSEIAKRSNLVYTGPSIFRDIPKDTSNEESTTFATLINDRANWFGVFPFWSDANSVVGKSWTNPDAGPTFGDAQIIGDSPTGPVEVTINQVLEEVDLQPVEVTWGYDEADDTDDLEEESDESQRPQFDYEPPDEYQIVDPPDGSARVPPVSITALKTVSLNYDLSGPFEIETTTDFIGENKIREVVDIYGFAYNAIDIINNGELNGDPKLFWQIVDSRTIDYLYDRFTGYLTGTNINGYQVRRYQTENDQDLQTIELDVAANADPPDETALNELNTYRFTQSPLTGFNRKLLAQTRDYFGASNGKRAKAKDKYLFYEECGTDGRLRLRNIPNPNYVEPFFEAVNVDYLYNLSTVQNPNDTTIQDRNGNEITRPPLTTGEERFNRSEIKVVETLNTPNNPPSKRMLPNSRSEVSKDFYLQRNLSYTARDPAFRNYKADSNSELIEGTPSEAARIPRFYVLAEDGSGNAELPTEDRNVEPRTDELRYVIYSREYNRDSPIVNNQNFPELTSFAAVLQVIRIQYEIDRFLNQSNLVFKSNFVPSLKEGSQIIVIYGKFNFIGRVISVDHENIVLGNTNLNQKYSGSSTITIGFIEPLPLFDYNFPDDLDEEDENSENLESESILNLFYKGKEIEGDPTYIDVISGIFNRGNL